MVTIGEVIAGSAGTVALTFLGLSFATLGVFSTVGPALAATIFIGFLGSITLLPAFIVLAGRRGWVNPRKDITGPIWRRMGVSIVRRPKRNLFGSLVILVALAGCALLVDFNYDDRKNLPRDSESNQSYETMNAHFPVEHLDAAVHRGALRDPGSALTPGAGRHGADGPADQPAARHRRGPRHHPAQRRDAERGQGHLPGR